MSFWDQLKCFTSSDIIVGAETALAAAVILVFCYLNFVKQSRTRQFLYQFNGPMSFPIIGNSWIFWNPQKFLKNMRDLPSKYGSRVRLLIGSQNILCLCHPDDIKTVLHSTELLHKGIVYKFLRPQLGNGLILSSGAVWQSRRKLINPAFHRASMLEHFQNVFAEQASVMVNIFMQEIQKNSSEIRLHSSLQRLTLDIICGTTIGVKMHCQLKQTEELFSVFKNVTEITNNRIKKPWLHPDFIFDMTSTGRQFKSYVDYLNSFIDKVIESRRDHLMKSNSCNEAHLNGKDNLSSKHNVQILLDLLIEEQLNGDLTLTNQDIKDELLVFMFAGHDTTSAAMFWAVMLLAAHPKAQAELHAELDSVFGKDSQRPLNKEDLSKLKFLDACIKESLRLYPSSAVLSRELKQDFILDSATIIPKGVEIAICQYSTQYLPEYFPNPMEFIPSRHYSANSTDRHPFAFVPFSAGPRNCVGQKYAMLQEKVVLAHIFRNFIVTPVDPINSICQIPQITIVPNIDARCRFAIRREPGSVISQSPCSTY